MPDFIVLCHPFHIITKLPESGNLCGNITEFGVTEHKLPNILKGTEVTHVPPLSLET